MDDGKVPLEMALVWAQRGFLLLRAFLNLVRFLRTERYLKLEHTIESV